MKLSVMSDYRNDARGLAFRKGDVVEVEAAIAAYLFADSPESFKEYEEPRANKRVAPKVEE